MATIEQVKPAGGAKVAASPDGGPTAVTFLTEVRNEMRRVTWPARKEVYATTVVVILTSTFFGLYLWGLDLALNRAVNWIFQRFGAA